MYRNKRYNEDFSPAGCVCSRHHCIQDCSFIKLHEMQFPGIHRWLLQKTKKSEGQDLSQISDSTVSTVHVLIRSDLHLSTKLSCPCLGSRVLGRGDSRHCACAQSCMHTSFTACHDLLFPIKWSSRRLPVIDKLLQEEPRDRPTVSREEDQATEWKTGGKVTLGYLFRPESYAVMNTGMVRGNQAQ